MPEHVKETRKFGFADAAKSAETLDFSGPDRGQLCPQDYPHIDIAETSAPDALGGAMSIGQVAQMLGCSVWTVRQRYIPQGLPHLRASAAGRLVFFRNQVTTWILERQKKEVKQK